MPSMSMDEDAVLLLDGEMLSEPPGVQNLTINPEPSVNLNYTPGRTRSYLEKIELYVWSPETPPYDLSVICVDGTSSALLRQNRHDPPPKGI